jgi:hypothetical protein
MMKKKIIACVLIIIGFGLTGCSGNHRLSGKVTFEDGTSATRGMVIFTTETFQANGEIQQDGTFVVGSEKVGDGIPKGTYKVYVTGIGKLIGEGMGGTPLFVSTVHEKYMSASTSGLTCTVPAPGNKFDLVLEPHPTNYP